MGQGERQAVAVSDVLRGASAEEAFGEYREKAVRDLRYLEGLGHDVFHRIWNPSISMPKKALNLISEGLIEVSGLLEQSFQSALPEGEIKVFRSLIGAEDWDTGSGPVTVGGVLNQETEFNNRVRQVKPLDET
jgi:hypothetical protein